MNTQTVIDPLAASPSGDLLQSDRTLRKPLAIDLFCGLGGCRLADAAGKS